MTKFIDIEDVMQSFTEKEQAEINEITRANIIAYEASQLNTSKRVQKFASEIKNMGAKLFVRLPTGKEVELHLPYHA